MSLTSAEDKQIIDSAIIEVGKWAAEERAGGTSAKPLEINIVIVGATGDGKSSTGNTLLAAELFRSARGQNAQTTESSAKQLDVDVPEYGRVKLTVIDTPGLGDAADVHAERRRLWEIDHELESVQNFRGAVRRKELESEKVAVNAAMDEKMKANWTLREEEIKKCLDVAMPVNSQGVHAFFMTMRWDERLSDTSTNACAEIRRIFGGEKFDPYVFVIFTRGDYLLKGENVLVRLSEETKSYLNKIGHRYCVVDNTLLMQNRMEELFAWRQDVLLRVLMHARDRRPFTFLSFLAPKLSMALLGGLQEKFYEYRKCKDEVFNALDRDKSFWEKHGLSVLKITGAGTSLAIGGALIAVGIALAGVTFGGSLALSIVGAVVSLGGSGTAAGAHLKKRVDEKKETGPLVDIIKSASALTAHLFDAKCHYATIQQSVSRWHASGERSEKVTDYALLTPSAIASSLFNPVTITEGLGGVGRLSATIVGRIVAAVAIDAADDVAKMLSVVSTAVPIAGLVVGSLLDILTIGHTIYELRTEKHAKKVEELKKACNESFERIMNAMQEFADEVMHFVQDPEKCIEEEWICCICHDPWTNPVLCAATKAHVVGCSVCIDNWLSRALASGSEPTCPMCTKKWNMKDEF